MVAEKGPGGKKSLKELLTQPIGQGKEKQGKKGADSGVDRGRSGSAERSGGKGPKKEKAGRSRQSGPSESLGKEQVLAVDIGSRSIKVASGRVLGSRISIDHLAERELRGTFYEDGRFRDMEAVQVALMELLGEAGIRHKKIKVICTVESNEIIKRRLVMPDVSEQDMADMIAYEVGQFLGDSTDAYFFQYKKKQKDEGVYENEIKLTSVAMPKGIAQAFYDLIEQVGLVPYALDLNFNALEKLLRLDPQWGAAIGNKNVAIAELGHSYTNINIFENGEYFFNSLLEAGGKDMDRVISGLYKTDMETANQEKKSVFSQKGQYPLLFQPNSRYKEMSKEEQERAQMLLLEPVDKIVEEIGKVINFYDSRNENKKVGQILLYGGSALLPGLDSYIQKKLQVPAAVLNSLSCVDFSRNAGGRLPYSIAGYINCIGAMIRR